MSNSTRPANPAERADQPRNLLYRRWRRSPTGFWFAISVLVLVVFGAILAIVMYLSVDRHKTSVGPNEKPRNNSAHLVVGQPGPILH